MNGKYSSSHFIGWFVGFAPATRPKVVTLVMVDDPKRGYDGTPGDYYGGKTAAPAWAELTGPRARHPRRPEGPLTGAATTLPYTPATCA